MKRIIPLLLLLLSSTLYGQITIEKKLVVEGVNDPVFVGSTLVLPAESKLVVKEAVKVSVDSSYKFNDILVKKDGVSVPVSDTELLFSDPGTYEINVVLFDPEKGIKRGTEVIKLGGTPSPPPGPTPPSPTPTPDKIDNISVLMIYESALLPTYPAGKRAVLNSTDLRGYMSNTVSKDGTGFPNWRVLDKDTSFPKTCDTVFCKWLGTATPSELPWLVIGNKDTIVHQGPLPADAETIKSLITKYKR